MKPIKLDLNLYSIFYIQTFYLIKENQSSEILSDKSISSSSAGSSNIARSSNSERSSNSARSSNKADLSRFESEFLRNWKDKNVRFLRLLTI
jgi:hypothetical protein